MADATRVKVFSSHDAEYTAAFEVFLQHTDQKRQALAWLEQQVAALPRRDLFVDAGAGNGLLTAQLQPQFRRTIALEPNPTLAAELRRNCPTVEVRPAIISEAGAISEADLVLCSHVFYYVPVAAWEPTLQRLVSWLRPGGRAILALQNRQSDCMRLAAHFTGADFDLGRLAQSWIDTGDQRLEVNLTTVPATIATETTATAYQIAEFVLNILPMPNPPLRAALEEYVQTHFQQPGGGCRFSCDQDFLHLHCRESC